MNVPGFWTLVLLRGVGVGHGLDVVEGSGGDALGQCCDQVGVIGAVNCDVAKSELGLCLCELGSWLMGPEGWQPEGHGIVLGRVVLVVLVCRHDGSILAPCRRSPCRRSPCRSWLPD